MFYFYSVRQLDLFATLFEIPPAEKKAEDSQSIVKNEDDVSSVSKTGETPFSLVELAEETLGATPFNRPGEISKPDRYNLNLTNRKEKESILSSQNEITNQKSLEAANPEKLQIAAKSFDEVKAVTQIQKETNLPKPERNGAVIFDDGKISVKIKSKPVVPAADTTEKVRKEPQKRGRKPIKEIEAEADLIEVPDDEVLFQKQYYPISEVAKWFRVNTSLLRFWENEFDILKPRKNRKGDRLFRPEDVKSLQLIYQLLRQRKYTIEGAKEYIKTNRKKADVELQLTNTLQKFKNFLLDIKTNL